MTEREKIKLARKEQFKTMKLSEKADYFWTYYKMPVLVTAFVFFMIFSIVYEMATKVEVAWNIFVINDRIESEQINQLSEDFGRNFMKDTEREYAFDTSVRLATSEEEVQADGYEMLAKVMTMIAAGDLDSIISEETIIQQYAAEGGFADLEMVLDKELLEKLEPHLIYLEDSQEEGKAYAVSLQETKFMELEGQVLENPMIGIISNSERQDISVKFLEYIFE